MCARCSETSPRKFSDSRPRRRRTSVVARNRRCARDSDGIPQGRDSACRGLVRSATARPEGIVMLISTQCSWRVARYGECERPDRRIRLSAGRDAPSNYALRASAKPASKRSVVSLNEPLTMFGGSLAARIPAAPAPRHLLGAPCWTVRARGTVYCHKVAVARRQRKIVAT